MKAHTQPPALPEGLRGEAPLTKFLYFWLEPQGTVDFSARELVGLTGVSYRSALLGLNRLRERGLVEDVGERRERLRSSYRAVPFRGAGRG